VPDNNRYTVGHNLVRGDAGTYNHLAATLEDEANADGWLPGARPTGPPPRNLFTIGMRGEPGYDDDPEPGTDGQYHHSAPEASDNSSWD
jgi:hypothetical protein